MKLLLPIYTVLVLFLTACTHSEVPITALAFQQQAGHGWGLLNTDGSVLVASNTYRYKPTSAVNGMFAVPDSTGMYQLYNTDDPHRPVSPRRFASIGHFFEDVTWAQDTPEAPLLLIDKQGQTVASTQAYAHFDIAAAHNFSEGLALVVTRNGKYGYINTAGRMVIPTLYDRAYDFGDGLALVGITNPQGQTAYQFIDRRGKVRLSPQLGNCLLSTRFSNGLLMYKNLNNNQCCYLDKEGLSLICLPPAIEQACDFCHESAICHTANGVGVIDLVGENLIPPTYEDARILGQHRLALQLNGQWSMAQYNGTLLSEYVYDAIGNFYASQLAVARREGSFWLIDTEGRPVGTTPYACIAEEATAWHEVPQVFVRRQKTETAPTADTTPAQQTAQQPEPADTKAQPSLQPRAARKSLPAQSQLRSSEWKEISRQNPFYEEARKVLSGKLEEKDAAHRQMILNYVEHLRTSYTTKDIDFLEQLFSEHALIVVGTVVHTGTEANNYLSPSQVIYNVKSKRQYLDRLKQVFRANKHIDVKFSNFRIMRHPTQAGIYGVSLRQGYSSDIYSDDGYLFLLWDFRDETAPQIHVRTWQPRWLDNNQTLPEESIFNIRNFNLQ